MKKAISTTTTNAATNMISYPSKGFSRIIHTHINNRISFQINVESNWRSALVRQSIEFWPKFNGDEANKKASLFLRARYMVFLFPLMSVHVWALGAGYIFGYKLLDEQIELHYTCNWVKDSEST